MDLKGYVYLISRSWWEEIQKNKRNPKISKIRSKLRQLEVSEGKYFQYMFYSIIISILENQEKLYKAVHKKIG